MSTTYRVSALRTGTIARHVVSYTFRADDPEHARELAKIAMLVEYGAQPVHVLARELHPKQHDRCVACDKVLLTKDTGLYNPRTGVCYCKGCAL
jgi:hypothetical protein